MDVHPPLAKLLLTLAGWLAGFDGEFDFKDIGKDYLEPGVPYVAMRMLPAYLWHSAGSNYVLDSEGRRMQNYDSCNGSLSDRLW